ncbi:MAG: ABC transporter substrate-binding protein, partial [Rhodocyclaceae bacterium]|nr:ABC transporter substrate-binding protein [Rhodocyclaceae bacterium]
AGAATLAATAVYGQTQEKLRVYTAWPEQFSTPLFNAFTQQTGIEVQFVRQSAGELLARLRAEKANPQVDLMFGGPADTFHAAKNAGLLEPYKGAGWAAIPDAYKDPDGYYTGFARLTIVFMTNAAFLKDKKLSAPASWADLLNPAYRKQIQTADARTSGTAMTRLLSIYYAFGKDEAKALDYQKKLNENVQSYTKSGAGGAIPVAMGQAAIALLHTVEALETKRKGYDVVITVPSDGVVEGIEGMAMVKGVKNRELAAKFLDWAASPKMQDLFVANSIFVLPTHPQAKPEPEIAQMMKSAKLYQVDLEWAGANRKRLVDQWINEVAR